MTIVYTAGGTDIITATATNGLGSGSATHTVFVRDCSGISTFPWNEGFEQAGMLACWTMVDADNDGYNWPHATTSGYARNGTGYMMSASYESAELYPDNYLISPAIILPDEDGFIAEYYVGAYSSSYYAEHISVYVATSTDVTAIAASTPAESYTLSGADYVKHTISLNDYAGQTIYLVFRHHQSSDQWYLHLDDVAVRRTMAPVVSIAGITVMQGGSTIDMVKLSSGNYGSQTVTTCLGQPVTLSRTSGTFDYEASFSIVNANGIEVYAVDDCSGLTSGEVFLTFDATCHADGEEPGPEPETCNVPTNLHTVNVPTTVASVDWTAGGTESAWQLEVNGTVYSASGHPYTLANLSAGTQYSVRVRAVCGDSLYSEWSTALTFSTENETPVPPDGIDGVDAVPFALYPNPASSVVYVEVDGSAWISLLDLNGRKLLRTDKPSFDVTVLPQGTYLVRVTTTEGSAVRKLVVR